MLTCTYALLSEYPLKAPTVPKHDVATQSVEAGESSTLVSVTHELEHMVAPMISPVEAYPGCVPPIVEPAKEDPLIERETPLGTLPGLAATAGAPNMPINPPILLIPKLLTDPPPDIMMLLLDPLIVVFPELITPMRPPTKSEHVLHAEPAG